MKVRVNKQVFDTSTLMLGTSVFVLSFILVALIDGALVSTMWNWFLVPYVHAPELNVLTALGVVLTCSVVFTRPAYKGLKLDTRSIMFNRVCTFLVGWLLHLSMVRMGV